MKLLERYILARMATAGIGSFVAILAVVWITQAVPRLDFATGSGQSMGSLLLFLVAILPQLAGLTLPFGVLIGVVQVLNTLNSNAELPVMASSGVNRWQLARPAIYLGSAASLYLLFAAHFVEPHINRVSRDILIDARADLLTSLIQPGQFRKLDTNMTVYVERKDPAEGLLGLMISDTRETDIELVYHARAAATAEIDGQPALILRDGQIHRRDPANGAVSVVRFDTYAISLGSFASTGTGKYYALRERPTSDLLAPDPDDRYMQDRIFRAKAEVHRRFTDWMYAFLFAMIGLVLAGKPVTSRQQSVAIMGLAFGGALVWRGLGYYAVGINAGTERFLWAIYAVPIVGIGFNLWMYHTGRTVTIPSGLFAGLKNRFGSIRARLRRNAVATP